jgi:O-acetyl-ADP-ribose deacetylase (regulator of RNase III)
MNEVPHLQSVVTAAGAPAPFPVEAVVYEDDTQMVLGSDPLVREVSVPASDLIADIAGAKPQPPGTVVVREGPPLRFHAIVHDLQREPSWREEWISSALAGVFDEANALDVGSLALPVLGSLYGQLDPQRFCQLLDLELKRVFSSSVERIWLVVVGDAEAVQDRLNHLGWG